MASVQALNRSQKLIRRVEMPTTIKYRKYGAEKIARRGQMCISKTVFLILVLSAKGPNRNTKNAVGLSGPAKGSLIFLKVRFGSNSGNYPSC